MSLRITENAISLASCSFEDEAARIEFTDRVNMIFDNLRKNEEAYFSKVNQSRIVLNNYKYNRIKSFYFSGNKFFLSKNKVWLQLDKKIGFGAVFNVMLGIDVAEGRPVAIKRSINSPKSLIQAENHVKTTKRHFCSPIESSSKRVVRDEDVAPYESPSGQKAVIIVQPLLKCNLSRAIENNYFADEASKRNALIDIARSVQYIHAKGLVNGDLKPINFLVSEQGQCSISDHDTLTPPDAPGFQTSPRGTRTYLAPEALLRKMGASVNHPLGQPVDLWATGLIYYLILTRKALPWIFENNYLATYQSVCQFVQNGEFLQGVPESYHPLLKGLFVIDPQKRITITDVFRLLEIPLPTKLPDDKENNPTSEVDDGDPFWSYNGSPSESSSANPPTAQDLTELDTSLSSDESSSLQSSSLTRGSRSI